jgi:hypothetical protein
LLHLVSIVLAVLAGASVYLFFLNRVLIQMRDARYKSFLIRTGGLVAVGAAAAFGYLAAGTLWMALPLLALSATAAGEARRWAIRRRFRGAGPVAQEGSEIRLTRPATTTDLALRRYAVRVPGWAGPRLRVAHVSDLHLNSHLPLAYYREALRRTAAAQPDLLFYTGDFVTYAEYADRLPDLLGLAAGRLGAFAILGNHDYWADPAAVRRAVAAAGVTLVGERSVRVAAASGATVLIAGCEAPWSGPLAAPPAPAVGELALLLTHTPDNVYRLSRLGYAAIFAGHYHAGQMRLPGLGPLVAPSRYGRRFDHGHFVLRNTHLFVTAGVGSAEPPLRLWCQPDIFIVDFEGSDG